MTKKIVKRTDANNETLYFYTHSDAVDVGEGSSTKSLTEVIDDTLHKSAQTLTNAEKAQVYENLGLNGVDDVPTENSNNVVRSGGVKAAIDDVIDDFTNRGFMYKGIAPASAPLGEDKTFYIAKPGDYTAYTGIGDGSFTLNGIAVLTYDTASASGGWTKNNIVLFDEEPTAGSGKFVKSGGVIGNVFCRKGLTIRNGIIGDTTTEGAVITDYIDITNLDVISLIARSSNVVSAYAFYYEDKTYIEGTAVGGTENNRKLITITKDEFPANAKYIVVNGGNSTDSFSGITLSSVGRDVTKLRDEILGKIKSDLDDADNSHIPTTKAAKDYIDIHAGVLDANTLVLERDGVKIQETWILEKPDVSYFLDTYSYYEPCIDELYIVPGNTNIVFKYYSNRLFVRPKDGNNYKWQVVVNANTLVDNKIIELKVTTAGTDDNYAVGDIVGYVIFKDVESFIGYPYAQNSATLNSSVVTNIYNSPKIKEELGYYNNLPVIIDKTLKLPYTLKNPTTDDLQERLEDVESKVDDLKVNTLNILFIGNSYTANSVSYVPFILKNICPDLKFKIGVLFLDGGTLAEHLANILNEDVVDEGGTTQSPQNYNKYSYITDDRNSWSHVSTNVTIFTGLDDANWDIVSTHQANRYAAGEWSTKYAPYIYRLHKAIADYLDYPFKFGWDIIHGSNAETYEGDKAKFLSIASNAQTLEEDTCTEIIFPYGTAVENLRTIASMQLLGDGSHQNLLKDASHLQSGIGQLAASYAIAIKLVEQAGCISKIISEGTFPTTEWVNSISTIRGADIGTGSIGITEHNCFLAQVAAIQAVKKPYEIIDINPYDMVV